MSAAVQHLRVERRANVVVAESRAASADALGGTSVLLEARIIAVADVVEAMASHRPYRPALGVEAALAEISSGRGVLYDAEVADACMRVFSAGFAFEG